MGGKCLKVLIISLKNYYLTLRIKLVKLYFNICHLSSCLYLISSYLISSIIKQKTIHGAAKGESQLFTLVDVHPSSEKKMSPPKSYKPLYKIRTCKHVRSCKKNVYTQSHTHTLAFRDNCIRKLVANDGKFFGTQQKFKVQFRSSIICRKIIRCIVLLTSFIPDFFKPFGNGVGLDYQLPLLRFHLPRHFNILK